MSPYFYFIFLYVKYYINDYICIYIYHQLPLTKTREDQQNMFEISGL